MDIKGRRVLVLGGFGMVGSAVCRELLERGASHIVISSLQEEIAKPLEVEMICVSLG